MPPTPPSGRARSNAIFIPGGPGQGGIMEAMARREIELARERNLREMFAGTTFVTKISAQAKRAKEVADAAKKAKNDVKLALERVHVPTVNLSIPAIDLPNISLPSIDLPDLPDLPRIPNLPRLPSFPRLPDLHIPNIDLPNFDLPDIDLPSLSLPSIDLPGFGTLDLTIPGLRGVLQLLVDLFDGLDLPDILIEIGADIFVDFVSAALPVLGQLKSGAQAASEWGKAAKKAYQVYKVTAQKELLLPGDPRVAADAVKLLLKRAGLDHTAKATIKTTQFATSSAGLALDAGALTGPLIAAAASLATLSLRIYAIGLAHKEKVAGNLALKSPEKLDARIFVPCPILGCYLLTCSDTSSVINILTSQIGANNWMNDVQAMKRKLDPLLLEATNFIRTSPYELQGLKANKGIYAPKKKSFFSR